MKKLTLEETQALVDKYARSHGQRGAARALTRDGYRSPEGCEIKQGHVCRIQAGSWTCFLAPESPIEVEGRCGKITTTAPKAQRLPVGEPYPEHCLEQGPALASSSKGEVNLPHPSDGEDIEPPDPREVRQRLKNELIAEEILRQEKELTLPPYVPSPRDHTTREHSHLQRDVRISAVFRRRGTVELDEDRGDFFGIPRLARQPPKVTSRPYETRSYAVLTTGSTRPYTREFKKS